MEKWKWVALYNDGTKLHQFDGNTIHNTKEIDYSKILMFIVYSDEHPFSFNLPYEDGIKFFFQYERYILNLKTPQEKKITFYVFGYEKENEKKYFVITPSLDVIITSDLNKISLNNLWIT